VADEERAGWWIASDGRAYPPEARPQAPTPDGDATLQSPTPPPPWQAPTNPSGPPPAPTWGRASQLTPPPAPPGQQVQASPYYGPSAYQQTPGFNLPGGGPWAAPQQIAVANVSKSPGLAVASLVLGIGSFFFALIPFVGFTSIPFAVTGVALGIAGLMRAQKGYEGKGLSIAGLATSVAAILVSALYMLIFVVAADDASDGIDSDPSNGICNPERFLQDPDC
jgi:hypothetical protein